MAGGDNFGLCLDKYEENVTKCWQELQIEQDFCDVTLSCEDKQIQIHKVITASISPVLRNILKFNQNPHPSVLY